MKRLLSLLFALALPFTAPPQATVQFKTLPSLLDVSDAAAFTSGNILIGNGSTWISIGTGTGVSTWLTTPSVANLNTALGSTLVTTTTINNATLPVSFTTLAASGASTLGATVDIQGSGASATSVLSTAGAWKRSSAGGSAQVLINESGATTLSTASSAGTGLAINMTNNGDFVNFLINNASKFLVDKNGSVSASGNAIISGATQMYNGLSVLGGNFSVTGASTLTGNVTTAGKVSNTKISTTLGSAVTTLAVTNNFVHLTGHASGNTLATITGGQSGQTLTLLFVDALVTITDTDAATANTVDLSAAFTSTARDTLMLIFDGNKWIEVSRSVN